MGRCLDPIKEIERRRKIGLNSLGNKYALGHIPTREELKKKSEGLIKAHRRKDFGFKRGFTPWNKNIPCKEETKRKISKSKKGYHPITEFKKGCISWSKNLTKYDDERIKKKGEKTSKTRKYLFSIGKLTVWNKNKKTGFMSKNPEKTRRKLSEGQKATYQNGRVSYFKERYGELHPMYKGEKCKKKQKRNDPAYVNWVIRTKRRDKNVCQLKDEKCSGYNIVHHIKAWLQYPELRYDINNGITLCQFHHPLKRKDEIKFIPIFMKLVRQKN